MQLYLLFPSVYKLNLFPDIITNTGLVNFKLGDVIFRLLIEIIILLFTTHTPHQFV